jgi:hypothetical protein
MRDLNLTITRNADALGATLRADRIRRDTLTQLAAALRGDRSTDVQNALDALIDAVDNPRDTGGCEIDALVAEIEAEAGMDSATVDLTPTALDQLARESADAYNTLAPPFRTATVTPFPEQRDRWSA